MAEKTVFVENNTLDKNDWQILRTITINSDERDDELGVILYTRPWTLN